MKLYAIGDSITIPRDPAYDSSDWFLSIVGDLKDYLVSFYGERELIDTPAITAAVYDYHKGEINKQQMESRILADIMRRIRLMMKGRAAAYERIFKAFTESYNPLWNKEGWEKREYERNNTGTQGNSGSSTSSGTNTGTQTNADTTGTTSTTSKTTYDSAVFKDTDKNVTTNSGNITRTDNLSNSQTSSGSSTRTDNLKETYTEDFTFGGNIGTTMTGQLIMDSLDANANNNFLEYVAHDIANAVTLQTYGGM